MGFSGGTVVKNPHANAGDTVSIPGSGISYSGIWPPTAILLFGKFHRQRNLAGDNPWGPKELDMTEQLSMQGHIM